MKWLKRSDIFKGPNGASPRFGLSPELEVSADPHYILSTGRNLIFDIRENLQYWFVSEDMIHYKTADHAYIILYQPELKRFVVVDPENKLWNGFYGLFVNIFKTIGKPFLLQNLDKHQPPSFTYKPAVELKELSLKQLQQYYIDMWEKQNPKPGDKVTMYGSSGVIVEETSIIKINKHNIYVNDPDSLPEIRETSYGFQTDLQRLDGNCYWTFIIEKDTEYESKAAG
mgnify:CR=1 FL=1